MIRKHLNDHRLQGEKDFDFSFLSCNFTIKSIKQLVKHQMNFHSKSTSETTDTIYDLEIEIMNL